MDVFDRFAVLKASFPLSSRLCFLATFPVSLNHVIPSLHVSSDQTERALDLCLVSSLHSVHLLLFSTTTDWGCQSVCYSTVSVSISVAVCQLTLTPPAKLSSAHLFGPAHPRPSLDFPPEPRLPFFHPSFLFLSLLPLHFFSLYPL